MDTCQPATNRTLLCNLLQILTLASKYSTEQIVPYPAYFEIKTQEDTVRLLKQWRAFLQGAWSSILELRFSALCWLQAPESISGAETSEKANEILLNLDYLYQEASPDDQEYLSKLLLESVVVLSPFGEQESNWVSSLVQKILNSAFQTGQVDLSRLQEACRYLENLQKTMLSTSSSSTDFSATNSLLNYQQVERKIKEILAGQDLQQD